MIYLDNAATAVLDKMALQKACQYYEDNYFNPSALYKQGVKLSGDITSIREQISAYFGPSYETVFTSCGTEADNMVLKAFSKHGNIVISAGEHSAIYECAKSLISVGKDIRIAKINQDGSVNEDSLLSLIDENTTLVSVIHVNNETGAINDISALSEKCKRKNSKILFHSDGVQAFLKTKKFSSFVDLYSVSAHKIGAIKGVGALIKKKNLFVSPLIIGGGQENGLRSGTENVLGILSFYYFFLNNKDNVDTNIEKTLKLKEIFIKNLTKNCTVISSEKASPYIISFSAVGLKSEVLVHMLEEYGVLIGMGSACSKNSDSRVLSNCGFNKSVLQGALRVSFGFLNTEQEVLFAVNKINECVDRLKRVMRV